MGEGHLAACGLSIITKDFLKPFFFFIFLLRSLAESAK